MNYNSRAESQSDEIEMKTSSSNADIPMSDVVNALGLVQARVGEFEGLFSNAFAKVVDNFSKSAQMVSSHLLSCCCVVL